MNRQKKIIISIVIKNITIAFATYVFSDVPNIKINIPMIKNNCLRIHESCNTILLKVLFLSLSFVLIISAIKIIYGAMMAVIPQKIAILLPLLKLINSLKYEPIISKSFINPLKQVIAQLIKNEPMPAKNLIILSNIHSKFFNTIIPLIAIS